MPGNFEKKYMQDGRSVSDYYNLRVGLAILDFVYVGNFCEIQ